LKTKATTKVATTKVKSKKSSKEDALKDLVVLGMQDKKAQDIVVIDLRSQKNAIADFFVVCSGTSNTHVESIADSIDDMVYKQSKESPRHKEGYETAEWVLVDYIDVVAHVFQKSKRGYYALEDLWGDAEIEYIKEIE
jgi:ribosome-associated protein